MIKKDPASKCDEEQFEVRTVDEVLQEIGFGRWQIALVVILSSGVIVDGAEIALLAFLSPCAGDYWNLGPAEKSLLAGAIFIGEWAGGLLWGPLSDQHGRKRIFTVTMTIITTFGLLSALAPNFLILVLLQMIVGFGVGGCCVPYDMLAEMVPTDVRSVVLSATQIAWGIGTCTVVAIAWAVLDTLGWRWLVALCTVPSAITLLSINFIPTSPRWLLSKGHEPEAREILMAAAESNGKKLAPFRLAGVKDPVDSKDKEDPFAVLAIFSLDLLLTTVPLIFMYFFSGMVYTGGIIIGTMIFKVPSTDQDSEGLCSFDYPDIFTGAFPEILSGVVTISVSVLFSRRPVMSVFAAMSSLVLLNLWISAGSVISVAVSIGLVRASTSIATTTLWMITPELYPTPVRSTAHAVLYSISRGGSLLAPFLVFSTFGLKSCCAVLGFMCLLWSIGSWIVPETAGLALDCACGMGTGRKYIPPSTYDGDREHFGEDESLLWSQPCTPLPIKNYTDDEHKNFSYAHKT